MMGYYRFLVRHPVVVIVITAVVAMTTSILGFVLPKYDLSYMQESFQNPAEGFEAKGTVLSGRFRQLRAFQSAVAWKITEKPSMTLTREKRSMDFDQFACPTAFDVDASYIDGYKKVVLSSSTSRSNLLEVDNLKALCRVKEIIVSDNTVAGERCPESVFTLSDAIASRSGKECESITQTDVDDIVRLMKTCYEDYKALSSQKTECLYESDMLINLYNLFVTNDFLNSLDNNSTLVLEKTLILVEDIGRSYEIPLYQYYKSHGAEIDTLIIEGIQATYQEDDLFSDYMIGDLKFFGVALVVLMIIMMIYLRSSLIVLGTFLGILFAFGVSYTVYHYIFQMKFFPFLNILALLVLIAVGADDVFVFYDAWKSAKVEFLSKFENTGANLGRDNAGYDDDEGSPGNLPANAEPPSDDNAPSTKAMLEYVMPVAFGHAIRSILVTSLTTASAFVSNYASKVIVVRCFGLFGMTCILVNFILMVTWIPAFVVCMEIMDKKCCTCTSKRFSWFKERLSHYVDEVFTNLLPSLVIKLRILWILLFTALGVWGIIATFVTPGLKRPSSTTIQYFPGSSILTKFETASVGFPYIENAKAVALVKPIAFIWGLSSEDNSDPLDPSSRVTLKLIPFSVSKLDEQQSLINFCHILPDQPWFDPRINYQQCYMDAYYDYITDSCANDTVNTDCCGVQNPRTEDTFNLCFKYFASINNASYLGKPYFDRDTGIFVAFSFEIAATMNGTSYEDTKDFIATIDKFVDENSGSLRGGTAFGQFFFYDLQNHLGSGMWTALWISLLLSVVIIFLTTMNLLISLYAVITIALAIFATIGALVLMKWELNIVESAIMTLAVGLSIDFTIHYGVAYVQSTRTSPSDRIRESFERVGSSVTMAAATTFLAGALIMPSHILAYQQLGIFLMIVMTIAWILSTFLFQGICALIGPKGDFLQVRLLRKKVNHENKVVANDNNAENGVTVSAISNSKNSNPTETNSAQEGNVTSKG